MKTIFFNFFRGLAVAVAVSLGLLAQAPPGSDPANPGPRPTLRILQPTNGASFVLGSPVKIIAELSANPPAEARVAIYGDGHVIGIAEKLPQITLFPPPPPAYMFTWTNPPAGEREVFASASYWNGGGFAPTIIVSPKVEFRVARESQPTNSIPVVTVRSLREEIVEGNGPTDAFEVHRTGPLDRSLSVEFELGGTAIRGTDYAIPFNRTQVEFAPGSENAHVIIRPALDARTEGRESVVIGLLAPAITTVVGAVPPYQLGRPARAETHIVDVRPANPPGIVWTEPENGSRFEAGATVHLRAVATDPAGYLPFVEFFAYPGDGTNGVKIGESELVFITAPEDGTPITHELDWVTTNASIGLNRIVARAPRGGNDSAAELRTVESRPLELQIVEPEPVHAFLTWNSPENGERFTAGETAHLRIVATDPGGYLPNVEFFTYEAGTTNAVKIGGSTIAFLVAPTNGTPVVHELDWVTTNAFDGANRLLARAVRADGSEVVSRHLTVFVTRERPVPTVGIHIESDFATEGNPLDRFVFHIARSGPVDEPLTVYFTTHGTSIRGYASALQREVDYWLELNPCPICAVAPAPVHGNEVIIPAGASEIRLGGRVVDDELVEGDESVVIQLIPGIPPNVELARPFYHLEDGAERAEAVIHDNDSALVLPVVTIHATDAHASETNAADTIVFDVRRSGPTNEALVVHFLPTGSAQFLVDYRRTTDPTNADPAVVLVRPFVVEIPAGETNGRIELAAISDNRREGDETVVINLTHRIPLPYERLRPTYEIGRPDSARAVIHDTPTAEEPVPAVEITATDDSATEPSRRSRGDEGLFTLSRSGPTNRSVVVGFSVAGTARNGRDYEYLDGDATIPAGATRREIRVAPFRDVHDEGDETVVLTLRPARGYDLGERTNATVTIREASGPTNDEPTLVITSPADDARFRSPTNVVIEAIAVDPQGDVRRVEFYANNRLLGVSENLLRAAIAPGTPVHHDFTWTNPPAGSYRLVAMALVGDREVRSDGVDIAVVPTAEPPVAIPHPAETEPEDFVLTADEAGAYAAAWRIGAGWSNRPNVIPPSFVARAGFLLQSGGAYEYRPRLAGAPLFWVPAPGTNDSGADVSGKAGSGSAKEEEHPVQVVLSNTTISGYVDTSIFFDFGPDPSVIWPEGLFDRAPLSFAVAEVPAGASASNSFAVTLRILPATGIKAHVVEFAVGAGATATNITDDGVFDAEAGVVRWGPFYDDANRRLGLVVGNTSPRQFGGVASFDGYDSRIRVTTALPADGRGPRITSIETRSDGAVQLFVVDGPDSASASAGHSIEVSNDLRTWRRVIQSEADVNGSVHVDTDAVEDPARYYRVVAE